MGSMFIPSSLTKQSLHLHLFAQNVLHFMNIKTICYSEHETISK